MVGAKEDDDLRAVRRESDTFAGPAKFAGPLLTPVHKPTPAMCEVTRCIVRTGRFTAVPPGRRCRTTDGSWPGR